MTDKQRQEFVEKWVSEFRGVVVADTCENLSWKLGKMLLEYDKLNDDRWERLKEFVEKEEEENEAKPSFDDYYIGEGAEIDIILAEIERLEKEGE